MNALTPIPQPAEIVGFIIRHFSWVDYENNDALKKRLQRLSEGSPLSIDAAMELLEANLAPLFDASGRLKFIQVEIRAALEEYISFCRTLDCGALPAIEVRRVFDKLGVVHFGDELSYFLPRFGLTNVDIIGRPNEGIANVWKAYKKDQSVTSFAEKFYQARAVSDGTWEANIRRWLGGGEMNVSTIMEITTKVDFDFGLALLIANAYRSYCALKCIDPSTHQAPFLESYSEITEEFQRLQSGPLAHYGALDPATECAVNDVARLIDPRRKKKQDDAAVALDLIARIDETLEGQERSAGIGVFRGRCQAQLGNLEEALTQFDRAANWFKFRSFEQLKVCLHYLFNISSALGEKQVANRWTGMAEAFGLETRPSLGPIAFLQDFQHPFVEATNWPARKPSDLNVVVLPEWDARKPYLKNPNRMVKGYGRTPSPQLHIFAHRGAVKKVHALLKAKADPNKLDPSNGSALLNAIQGGDDDCVQALVSVTATETIDTRSKGGRTCLHEAIGICKPNWVRALLKRGANSEVHGTDGQTALYAAASIFTNAEQILPNMTDPRSFRDTFRQSPSPPELTNSPFVNEQVDSWMASINEHPEIFEGIARFIAGQPGCEEDRRKIVTLLLDAGANVNAVTPLDGFTPFLYAAQIGNEWLFKKLLESGANTRQRTISGHTAYTLLQGYGHQQLANWFLNTTPAQDRIWLRETGAE